MLQQGIGLPGLIGHLVRIAPPQPVVRTPATGSSRFQEFTNLYFASALGLPAFPVATRDDGRFYMTEAE